MKKLAYILFISLLVLGLLSLVAYAFFARWPWPQVISDTFSPKGFQRLMKQGMLNILGQSILLSFLAATLSSIVGLMCSRALAFAWFRGKELLRLLFWSPLIVPATSYFIGLESLFTKLGLSDSVLGVILAHAIVILPYTIFTLEDIWRDLGTGYEEQAMSLGASRSQVIRTISLPLIAPALAASTGLGFVISFGQYFLTLMIGGGQVKTFALFVIPYIEGDNRLLAAASSLVFIAVCGTSYFVCLTLLKSSFYRHHSANR